jgi:predicted DNA-binding transcriptional regulator YafY
MKGFVGDIMFTTDEIFARLMNGESMDSIAKEMTDALNAAKEKKEAADKKKAEEEAKAKRKAVVNEAAEKAAVAVNELIRIMYPEMASETEQLTGRMMIDMVDSSYNLVKEVEKAIPALEKLTAGEPKETPKRGNRANFSTVEEISDADVESILNSFMKSL